MSQQEFEMGSQSNQQSSSNEEEEIHLPQYPYSWSGKIHPEGVPRDEPPSSYDATVMQQGYRAQTPNTPNTPVQQAQVNQQYQYIPPTGDGDAYEQGYRPNRNQKRQGGVPAWARPQQHPRDPVRFAFIILVLLGVSLLMVIFGAMGSVLGFIGGTIGAIILFILFIIFVPLLILFVIFGVIFRILSPRRARRRYRRRRRSPWW